VSRTEKFTEDREGSFRVSVGEMTDQLFERLTRATYDYTIPLILNDHLAGSGTLVTVDGHPGILTAADVIAEGGWDGIVGAKQALVTTLDSRALFLWLRMENLTWWLESAWSV
jgi:hypothetical protein